MNNPANMTPEERKAQMRTAMFSVTRLQAGMMLWFVGIGLHFVLLPAAGLVVLQLPPLAFASLYAASLLAMLVVMPMGWKKGKIKKKDQDKKQGKPASSSWAPRLWRNLMGVGLLLTAALAVLLWQNLLSLPLMLAYCALFAALATFFSPLRDALTHAGGSDIARSLLSLLLLKQASYKRMKYTTIRAMVLPYVAQALGFALAGATAWLPYVWLLPLAQTGLWLGGVGVLYNAPRVRPLGMFHHTEEDGSQRYPEGFGGALAATRYSAPKVYPMLLVNLGMGLFIVSPFLLLTPYLLLAAGGNLAMLAALNLAFWGGVMLTTGWMLYRPLTLFRGLNLCVTVWVSCGALFLVPLIADNMPALLGLCAVWGLINGSIFVNCRTLLQVYSPAGTWHRIIQVYHWLFLLGALVGTLGCAVLLDASAARLSSTASQVSTLGALAMALTVLVLALPLIRKR